MSFTGLFIILIVLVVLAFIINDFLFGSKRLQKREKYRYKKKNYFLTKSEHEFYDKLLAAVGDKYHIFAQVNLSNLLIHKIKGQNWKGAFAHINRKSVDFVLCDKEHLSPKLAIELDDRTHERPDRQERDRRVEGILKQAGIPLLRINNVSYNKEELIERIKELELK
jgi:very-short-patch-repair endonuclease